MKNWGARLSVALLFSSVAFAQDRKEKAMTPQRQMADCNAAAKSLGGDEYKKKHDACLKA